MRRCARRAVALARPVGWQRVALALSTAPARPYATSTSSPQSTSATKAERKLSDADLERDIMRKAMATPAASDSAQFMRSMDDADGFAEERITMPGRSDEDAFGHEDPFAAVQQTLQDMEKKEAASASADGAAAAAAATAAGVAAPEETTKAEVPSSGSTKQELANEIDAAISGTNRRRNRRKQTMDSILGDVLHDALRMRDMGEKPTADFVYKRTQERVYEEEYGKKPPTAKETASQYIPFPPDFHMHRLLPLFGDSVAPSSLSSEDGARGSEAGEVDAAAARPAMVNPVYTRNHMNTYVLCPSDPWPERAVTPENPVWTHRDVEMDRQKTGGKGLREWEEKMYAPRPDYDLVGEFVDAMDELAHWELQMLNFFRAVPITQRRSLPFLHEWYRLLVHRVVRAERRYTRVRDAVLPQSKATASVYARTEKLIEDVRGYYAETHRALSSPNYDVFRMKKSVLAPVLRMTDEEFAEWQDERRQKRNELAAELE